MAVEVGDAVYRFLGDTTSIDRAFAHIDDGVEKLPPVPPEVPESIKLTGRELREARGEARLLGEEIGVRLPRHVSNFLAEVPGVGKLLSAAFSATAITFLAKGLADVTSKVTDFVSNNLIYTQAMKDSNEATVEANKVLIELAENYNKAKEGIEKFGAAGTDSMRLQLQANQDQLANLKNNLIVGEQHNQQQRAVTHEYISQTGWLSKSYDWVHALVTGGRTQIDTIKAQTTAIQNNVLEDAARIKALNEQNALLDKQLETSHKIEAIKGGGEVQSADAKLRAAQKQAEVAEDNNTASARKNIAEQLEDQLYRIKYSGMQKQLAVLKENDENTKDEQAKLLNTMRVAADNQASVVLDRLVKSKDELQKTLQDIAKTVQTQLPDIQIVTPIAVANMLKGIDTAHQLGITLRQDLVAAYVAAKKAQDDFMASGIQDGVAQAAIAANIEKARKALDDYGTTEDKFKAKSHGLWNEFRQDTKEGATAMDQVKQLGVTAFDDLSRGLEQAISSAILAQGSFAQALEKATASALASIAAQAAVKALFYAAEGTAAAFTDPPASAAYFTASGEMAAVALVAGAAGHLLAGVGSSGSTNTQQSSNSGSNTTGQAGRSGGNTVGVQHFADGGYITGPTLAMIGEQNRKEAVLPLEDPRAMREVGKAVGAAGGGGGLHVHFHAPVVGASDVSKLTAQISKRVNRGQANLQSSNTLRITKRSA